MKRFNRRAFLQWLSPPAAAEPSAQASELAGVAPAPVAAASPAEATGPAVPPQDSASGFSLEAFYAARGPQKLPPIAIRPSVLHYACELTSVGCPPAHQPPQLDDDPLYARLAADAADTAAAPRGRR